MANVSRVTATWSGFQGAPGYSRFSFIELVDDTARNAAGAAVRNFFFGLTFGFLPTWTINVQPTIDVLDEGTGQLQRQDVMTSPPAAVTGTATAGTAYRGGVGAYVNWSTGLIFNGRRVRGRTYIVPMVVGQDTDGTISSSTISLMGTAAAGLVGATGAEFAVWARQFNSSTPPVQIGGATAAVQGYVIPDKTGILRSRRD